MRKELEESLSKDYPTLSQDIIFEVEDGWYEIIRDMFSEVDRLLNKKNSEGNEDHFRFSQIKEKWGLLRVYYYGYFDGIDEIISKYEKKSSSICEYCGSKGDRLKINGWYKTICQNDLD